MAFFQKVKEHAAKAQAFISEQQKKAAENARQRDAKELAKLLQENKQLKTKETIYKLKANIAERKAAIAPKREPSSFGFGGGMGGGSFGSFGGGMKEQPQLRKPAFKGIIGR